MSEIEQAELSRLHDRMAWLESRLSSLEDENLQLRRAHGEAPSDGETGRIGRRALLVGAVGAAGMLLSPRPAAAANGDALTAGGGVLSCTSITGVQTTGAIGLYGESSAPSGAQGVSGRATSSSGNANGVLGQSDSTEGTGVYGLASPFTGTNYGVSGTSNSGSGTGVYGLAWNSTGANVGVRGRTNSPDGWAMYSDGRMKVTGRSFLRTPNKKPNDADLDEGSVSFFLDQANDRLRVRVRYGDGRLRTGSVALH